MSDTISDDRLVKLPYIHPGKVKKGFFRRLEDRTVFIVTGLLCALLAAYPVVWLIYGSFRDAPPLREGSYTLANYVTIFMRPDIWTTVGNTLIFASGQTLFALVLASFLAWVVALTNTPGRRLFGFFIITLFLYPMILAITAWRLLLAPERGWLNILLEWMTGGYLSGLNVNSMGGMIWVQGLYVTPLAFLILAPAFSSMDWSALEAARICGASKWYAFRRVGLPMLRPALVSTALLLFIIGLESFDVPQLLGSSEGTFMLTSLIFRYIRVRWPPDYGIASALSIFLLIASILCVYLYRRSLRNEARFVTITGKPVAARPFELGRSKWLVSAMCWSFFGLTIVLPSTVLLLGSFLSYFGRFGQDIFSRMSLENYQKILTHPSLLEGFRNSLVLSLSSGVVCVFLAAIVGYIVIKTRLPSRGVLETVAMVPLAFPATVLGLAMLWAWISVPVPVYGSLLILAIAYITRYLSLGLRTVSGGLMQIDNELDEAARSSGASLLKTFFWITIPLLRSGLGAAWLLMFLVFFRELAMSVILSSAGNPVVSVVLFDYYTSGEYGTLAAFGVLMLVFVLVCVAIFRHIFKIGWENMNV